MSRVRLALSLPVVLSLAGCFGATLDQPGSPPQAAAGSISAPLSQRDLVGSWGLAAYHKAADAPRMETEARNQCGQPYSIRAGSSGGVMMHLPDQTSQTELFVKSSLGGTFIGPSGEGGGLRDREVVKWNGRVLALRWIDPEVSARYGIMVFHRCGGGRA